METKNLLCQICHKNKATIDYANGWMEFTHGFTKRICSDCYDNITKNSEWYKRGFEDGKKCIIPEKLRTHPSGNICCQGCYKIGLVQGKEEGKAEGKQEAEDIKAEQLADHYQKGKLESIEEELKFLNELEIFKIPITCKTCQIICPKIGHRFQKLDKLLKNKNTIKKENMGKLKQ